MISAVFSSDVLLVLRKPIAAAEKVKAPEMIHAEVLLYGGTMARRRYSAYEWQARN